MPISSNTTDYSTRTKDVHIFQGVAAPGTTTITPSFGRISNYCAGIQKLIQRYTISLLTAMGSQSAFPTFGSTLMPSLVRKNSLLSRVDFQHVFNFANAKVIKEFRDYQRRTPSLPTDEQLDTAVLNSIVSTNDSVSLSIQLYPKTGGSPVQFIIPLPENQ